MYKWASKITFSWGSRTPPYIKLRLWPTLQWLTLSEEPEVSLTTDLLQYHPIANLYSCWMEYSTSSWWEEKLQRLWYSVTDNLCFTMLGSSLAYCTLLLCKGVYVCWWCCGEFWYLNFKLNLQDCELKSTCREEKYIQIVSIIGIILGVIITGAGTVALVLFQQYVT